MDIHELALIRNILDQSLKKAGEKRTLRVNLLVSPFSNEREESIQSYGNDLAKNTRLKLLTGTDVRLDSMNVE